MDIVKANIVTSTAGRDKGEAFFVLATEGDFLLLADGKSRKVESAKRKDAARGPAEAQAAQTRGAAPARWGSGFPEDQKQRNHHK